MSQSLFCVNGLNCKKREGKDFYNILINAFKKYNVKKKNTLSIFKISFQEHFLKITMSCLQNL